MPETPEERAAQWKLYEEHYGPIPLPPEQFLEELAWERFAALFRHVPFDVWRPHGMGRG